jgi:hypothetical protein
MENKKELQTKLLAIQGILAIFKEANETPKSLQPIEAIQLMTKTLEAFTEMIVDGDNELEALDALLRQLLDEVL